MLNLWRLGEVYSCNRKAHEITYPRSNYSPSKGIGAERVVRSCADIIHIHLFSVLVRGEKVKVKGGGGGGGNFQAVISKPPL